MNKKIITLLFTMIAQASVLAQDVMYTSESSSCCTQSGCEKPYSCCPRTYSERSCCPQQECGGRRYTGSQRWRNCCGPRARKCRPKCRPKRTCCPRLRCCRPRPACCPPIAPPCEPAPCLQGNGYETFDENGSFLAETGVPAPAGPAKPAAPTQPMEEALDTI